MDETKNISIGYFGDGPWAHRALEMLCGDLGVQVNFVCARHDNPDPVLKGMAERYAIPFVTHPDVNSDGFLSIESKNPSDLWVSMSFNQIFRTQAIGCTSMGIVNCHAGKLPFYRGRNILNWALINDEKEFGITAHMVDAGVDTGDILVQKTYPITDTDTYATLLEKAHFECAEVLLEAVRNLRAGTAVRIKQATLHPTGMYCVARRAGDEKLEWCQSSREVFNFVRAICAPGPQARSYNGEDEIKINRVEEIPEAPKYKGVPGSVIGRDARGVLVKTADSLVRVVEWSSAKPLKTGDRLR